MAKKTLRQRVLDLIRENPGKYNGVQLLEALGLSPSQGWRMHINDLEKQGVIEWDKTGWKIKGQGGKPPEQQEIPEPWERVAEGEEAEREAREIGNPEPTEER